MLKKKYIKIYAEIVKMLAAQSTCTRAEVGALMLKDSRIVSTGYNGSTPGQPHCKDEGCLVIEGHCVRTVHAEQNALLFCAKEGISTKGCEMFVTHSPCPICTKLLVQAGIKKVYYVKAYRIDENPFKDLIDMEEIKLEE